MRWISFFLGTIALGILFGGAHRAVVDWVEPELRVPRSAAAVDVAMAVAEAGELGVRSFVEARENLVSLVLAQLAEGGLSPEAALEELQLGLPGVTAAALRQGERERARFGTSEFEAPDGPETALQAETLVVSRVLGPWQLSVAFETGGRVFEGFAAPQTALLRWRSGERVLAALGPQRLAQSRSEAETLGGVLRRTTVLPETEIEILALPPDSGLGTRLQEGIMWLGLGAFGILALTILFVPSPSRSAPSSAMAPAVEASPQPLTQAQPVQDALPESEVSPAAETASEPDPKPEPEPEPLGTASEAEAPSEPTGEVKAETPLGPVGSDALESPAEPASDRFPAPSEDLPSEGMAALGFASTPDSPLTSEGEDEGPSALPSELMQSASLPSLRPGAEQDEAEDEADGWSPALPESRTVPEWLSEASQPGPASEPPPLAAEPQHPSPPSAGPAADPPAAAPLAPRPRQPRDASLIAGAQLGAESEEAAQPFDPTHQREVYEAFLEARRSVGAPATGVSLEAFTRKLETSERSLIEKHGCRAVRFQVVERDGKVTLRPQLVR